MNAAEPRRARFLHPLWIACAVWLAFRALVLGTNFDAVSLPNYELMGIGNLGKLASEGRSGVRLVTYFDNSGGQLVDALLAGPLERLFGDSYATLKLIPVLHGLGALFLIGWILERRVSRLAAILGVLLFALTPPTLVKYSMLAKGNHFENLVFQLAALAAFLEAHGAGAKPRWNFAWAFAAGFAIFVSLDCVFLAASLAAVHVFVRGGRASARDAALVLPGFALGLVPLAWVQWTNGFSLVDFLGTAFEPEAALLLGRFVSRLFDLWTRLLPRAGVFEDLGPIPARAAEFAYLAAFLVAWASVARSVGGAAQRVWRARRGGAPTAGDTAELCLCAPLVLYLPLFSMAYAASAVEFDTFFPPVEVGTFRYLVPHFLFATLLIAIAAARLRAGSGARRALGTGLATAALASALFTLPLVDWRFARVGSGLRHPGYDFSFYANLVLKDVGWRPDRGTLGQHKERLAERLASLSPEARSRAWFGVAALGTAATLAQAKPGDAAAVRTLLRVVELDSEDAPALAQGVGSALRRQAQRGKEGWDETARWLEKLGSSRDPRAAHVVEGLCLPFGLRLESTTEADLAFDAELVAIVPASLWPALFRGHGLACGRLVRRGIPADRRAVRTWIKDLPLEHAADFWSGFGAGLADERADGRTLLAPEARLAGKKRDALLEGFGAELRRAVGASAARARVEILVASLGGASRPALERGIAREDDPPPAGR